MSDWHENEDSMEDFLKELLPKLSNPELGITKLVIDKGEAALSEKQSWIFKNNVLGEYVTEKCKICGDSDIPWSEMDTVYENGGICCRCAYTMSKD